jgi:ligand-binding sensor domain-containing protein
MNRWLLVALAIANLSFSLKAQIERANPNFECSIRDEKGTLWLGTKGAGLWRIQGNTVEFYSMLGQQAASDIYAMTLDRQGHLWLTTDRGLLEFDYEKWKSMNPQKEGAEIASSMSAFAQTNQIAVGITVNYMDHALLALENRNGGYRSLGYSDGSELIELMSDFKVEAIFEDLDAVIWMGNGGYKMENGKLKSVLKLPFGIITSAIQDATGDVWLGIDGPGVYRYDGKELRYYGEDHGFDGLLVQCIHEDFNGRIWMATKNVKNELDQGVSYFEAGLFHHLQDASDFPVISVKTIASDKKGNVWFAGDHGSLVKFNGRNFSVHTLEQLQIN